MHLEQTYTLRQEYLARIKYKSDFSHFNKKMSFKCIGEYIDKEPSETTSENISLDINSLHKQLDYIVYLSNLAYYYLQASGWRYYKLIGGENQTRLSNLMELIKRKQNFFHDALQHAIQYTSNPDQKMENLINNEIKYLDSFSKSEPSLSLKEANERSGGSIDFNGFKIQAENTSTTLKELLNSPTENTTMPELKNDTFEEQAENSPTDSGNCSDDDSEISDYQDAMESLEEEQNQTAPQVKEDDIAEDLEVQNEPTIQTESQEQNASNKNNLLTRLWDLLIRTWQHIKNIFKLFAENDGLNNTESVRPSHPTLQQSTFEENIPPIAAETKKPQSTPIRITNVPQTLFANKNLATMSEQTNARTAEWVTSHLPKFSMFS